MHSEFVIFRATISLAVIQHYYSGTEGTIVSTFYVGSETEFVALIFKKSLIKFLKSKSLLYLVWTGVEMKCNLIDGGGIQLIYGGNCTLMKID